MLQRSGYYTKHTLCIAQNILVGEAEHGEAAGPQVLVSSLVVCPDDRHAMTFPINLDHKLGMQAGKVDVIRPKLDLLAKMVATCSKGPQKLPKCFFRNCGIAPKLATQIAAHGCKLKPVALSRHKNQTAPPPRQGRLGGGVRASTLGRAAPLPDPPREGEGVD